MSVTGRLTMVRTYLVVLSPAYERDKIKEQFDKDPAISFWFFSLPHSIFVQTSLSARELSDKIMRRFGEHLHFVTEVPANHWGVLPKDHWPYFKS